MQCGTSSAMAEPIRLSRAPPPRVLPAASRPNASRDEFTASVGKFLRLKTDRDEKGSVLEAFRIENLSPADTTLIVETIDGHTIGAMIFGPLPETPRSPRPE